MDCQFAGAYTLIPIVPQFVVQCSNGVAVPNPSNNPDLVFDCASLLASKDALEGPSDDPKGAIDILNWSADIGISGWHGVITANNRVSYLRLFDSGLNGTIPPELGNLSNLNDLILDENQLTGEIPPELGNLANLRDLFLSYNQLTGEIPPELGNLANIEGLWLNDNHLTGVVPPGVGQPCQPQVVAAPQKSTDGRDTRGVGQPCQPNEVVSRQQSTDR